MYDSHDTSNSIESHALKCFTYQGESILKTTGYHHGNRGEVGNCMQDGCSFEHMFHGSVTVGERGQIVIPAEARKKHGIETGDKLLVFSHPSGGGLMVTKVDALQEMMQFFSKTIAQMEKAIESEAEK